MKTSISSCLKLGPVKRIAFLLVAVAMAAWGIGYISPSSQAADQEVAAPIYGVRIPDGYRNWRLISVGHLEAGKLDQLRPKWGTI